MPSAAVVVVALTAAPRSSVPVRFCVTPARPRSFGSCCTPSLARSANTVPERPTDSNSPKLFAVASMPAVSGMAVIAEGSVVTVVTVPPVLPAVVRPLMVALPSNTGCVACSVTV